MSKKMNLEERFVFSYYANDDEDGLLSSDKDFLLTDNQKDEIINHCNKFNIKTSINTIYDSLERYYKLHDRIGHSREESAKFINDGKETGEFLFLESGVIVQFD